METRSITPSELKLGQPLPWDVYGEGGGLLARKGYLIAASNQIENLIKRGKVAVEEQAVARPVPPSALRMLNEANRSLGKVLRDIANGRAYAARGALDAVAAMITAAVDLNTEVALACILHNQESAAYAVRHGIDTAIVALLAARAQRLAPGEIASLMGAALTMNVGMLDAQDRLQATAGALTADDVGLIHAHPETSVALLRRAGIDDKEWLDCVLLHHENEDGSGYPFGMAAATLPATAKLLALADRYCARVAARLYRKPMLPNAALRDLLIDAKTRTDPQMAALLIRVLGVYPVGTFVRLLNGEIGVVTRRGLSTTAPIVDALVGPRGAPLDVVLRRDTKEERHAVREVLSGEQTAIRFALEQLWGRVAST